VAAEERAGSRRRGGSGKARKRPLARPLSRRLPQVP